MTDAALGHGGVILALVASAAGVALQGTGLARHRPDLLRLGRLLAATVLCGALLATAALEHALVTHDFSLAFVAANNSLQTPLIYSITGMWSALQGSMLLWGLILAGYLVAASRRFRARAEDPVPAIALLVVFAVCAFFFALMVGPSDPFAATLGPIPADGAGPNVLLQDNPLVAIHPPLLYLGFVGFTVPYAFAVAGLVTGRVGEGWLAETRRFILVPWGCLSVGIVLGAWWSYQVLGWGGFWAWDPVENAAFLPWLTATAYLHSALVQERRGLLRVWNLSLLIATFALTILGTFLTRSGVVESVHAFSDSGMGPPLLAFFAAVVASGVVLIGWRGDRLRSPGTIDSPMSREGAFLVNNLLFAAFAFVVLLGTVFPMLVQAIDNQSLTIGRPYFDTMTLPIGVALLFFMAVAPVLPWRKAGPGVLRSRLAVPAWGAVTVLACCVLAGVRGLVPLGTFTLAAFAALVALRQLVLAARTAQRHGLRWWRGLAGRANGGMVVHLGVVAIAAGLAAASAYAHRGVVTLRTAGPPVVFAGQRLSLVGVRPFSDPSKRGEEVLVDIAGAGVFHPAFSQFNGDTEFVGTPAIHSTPFEDVYLSPYSLAPLRRGGYSAQLTVVVQPLVMWLWIGGGLIGLGSLLAAAPGRRRRPTDPVSVALPELAVERVGDASGAAALPAGAR